MARTRGAPGGEEPDPDGGVEDGDLGVPPEVGVPLMATGSRVILVTGASRGIGRAIAVAFGAEGARVVVNHPQDDEQAAVTAALVAEAGGDPLVVTADVSVAPQVAEM